ncbi:VOC family protein [Sphingobium phenoxybenzoativorans]|uniref:VOC family protein n=1 Tax=Sphingobium phenoxybenzoativorans TaxID=1592790 RepID=UPI000871D8E8|nr:VOC family protein [Sphingobium phenoxybenzoativorans]
MSKISPCLWFNGEAEEAANFYVDTFRDGEVGKIGRYPEDNPFPAPFPAGTAMMVEFTLFGQSYQALNGGPEFTFSEAISLSVVCSDQAELDRYFNALTADGGSPQPCGWLKDKYGLSWQLVPEAFLRMMESGDTAGIGRAMAEVAKMSKLDIATLEAAFAGETV